MRKSVYGLILFAVGLLVGFVPQYWKAYRLETDLSTCTANLELARARQSAALTYVSATQLNYGMASAYAQQFFGDVGRLATSTSNSSLRNALTTILSSRDKITSDLAKGNSEVVSELQPMVLTLLQTGP
jgi:hypothetical protein